VRDALKVYIGWDALDMDAYKVCEESLRDFSSVPLNVTCLKEHKVRATGLYWRPYRVDEKGQRWDDRDGRPYSTGFSFTRFAIPAMEHYDEGWVLFCDPDMLWQADVAELFAEADNDKALMCVPHDHTPPELDKMGGLLQTQYHRKNWSSLMLFNVHKNESLTKYRLNNMTGSWLHGMNWLKDEEIGALGEAWNWLEGWSDPAIDPKVIHYTRGTPDLPGCADVQYADRWWSALRGEPLAPSQAA
tara:strand:- start:3653 stop:4387 length:735 start_codon:yes stop_codon:yes gene_type:complete